MPFLEGSRWAQDNSAFSSSGSPTPLCRACTVLTRPREQTRSLSKQAASQEKTSNRCASPLSSLPYPPLPTSSHFSKLTPRPPPQPFILLARSILLAIETGKLDPDKAGSGVSYGERALRRVSSWNGSLDGNGRKGLLGGKCC